jgi:hypothetical protein
VGGEPGGTSASIHGLGYLFSALRRQRLIADELVLQLATFPRSLDLLLELIVLAPRTLTANQVRHGGKQGTDNAEHSRIHSSTWPSLTSLSRSFPAQRLNISLTSRSFLDRKPLRQQGSQNLCLWRISDGSLSFHFSHQGCFDNPNLLRKLRFL